MGICTDMTTLALPRGQTLRLRDARGARIECLAGSLWITQHGDRRDVTLQPGESFTLDRDGATLLYAFERSLALKLESRPVSARTSWWRRLGHALACHFMKLGMSRAGWRRAYRI